MKTWKRFIEWLRWKILKRRRHYGFDLGSEFSTWTLVEHDASRGTYKVLDSGTFPTSELERRA